MRYAINWIAAAIGADSDARKITTGCPLGRCKGYELLRDLDFNDPGSYRDAAANMRKWTGEGAWQPIALGSGTFSGIFKGNNKTIANLKVRKSGGLFASVGSDSHRAYIDGLGLLGVDIKGKQCCRNIYCVFAMRDKQ